MGYITAFFVILSISGSAFAGACALDIGGKYLNKDSGEIQIIQQPDCQTIKYESSRGENSDLIIDGQQHKMEGEHLVPNTYYVAVYQGPMLVTAIVTYDDENQSVPRLATLSTLIKNTDGSLITKVQDYVSGKYLRPVTWLRQ